DLTQGAKFSYVPVSDSIAILTEDLEESRQWEAAMIGYVVGARVNYLAMKRY
ncbi:hypothetical protein Ancab_023420, partial [Ancistrocladus abbreviatus]